MFERTHGDAHPKRVVTAQSAIRGARKAVDDING